MADDTGIESFLGDCEQRLKCHYVRPNCASPLPDATRLTRYLFPTSLHGIGIFQPLESATELLLVADISPRTFWNEVEEVFEDTAYKFSMSKKKIHPATAVTSQDAKASVLIVELRGRIILLEYCQARAADWIDDHGRISSTAEPESPLLTRARDIQLAHTKDTSDSDSDAFRETAEQCIQIAHDSGMLSGRLNLLTLHQLANAFTREQVQWATEQATEANMLAWLWELLASNAAVKRPIPTAIVAPGSPRDGLVMFRRAHPHSLLIQVNYWAPGCRLLFADAFFDVVATLQNASQKTSKYSARAWPYHLTDPAAEDGAAFYLIGVWRDEDGSADAVDMIELEKQCTTDRIYEITQDLLGYQYRVGKNGEDNECYIQSTLIASDDEFFTSSQDYIQRHLAPVRGLSSSALPKIEGETASEGSGSLEHQDTTEDTSTPPSTAFRTGKKVLDQLRWDPKYAGARSYEVGYVDRFSDELLWLPIEDWVQTTEEEEFIPLHRIRQYRNVITKEVVWDRAMRVDKLK